MPFLVDRDAESVIYLLGQLAEHLEAAIESCLLDGKLIPGDPVNASVVLDRLNLKKAKHLAQKLKLQSANEAALQPIPDGRVERQPIESLK